MRRSRLLRSPRFDRAANHLLLLGAPLCLVFVLADGRHSIVPR